MKNQAIFVISFLTLCGLIYIGSVYIPSGIDDQLKESHVHYVRGEKAQSVGERQEAFNQALNSYTALEKQYQPTFGNGKLYYNIGNTYFQLGEYPQAALNYYRALKLMPRSEKTVLNLYLTLQKLGIQPDKEASTFKKIFFFYHMLSLPERIQLFAALALAALLFGSLFIWLQSHWLRRFSIFFSLLTLVMLITLTYSFYLAPVEGVIVQSTGLYRDAGYQYAKVEEKPILSGLKVRVIDVLDDGKWLKVTTPEGSLGYVPDEAIRII